MYIVQLLAVVSLYEYYQLYLFPARQFDAFLSTRQVLNKMTTGYEVNKMIYLLSIHAHAGSTVRWTESTVL